MSGTPKAGKAISTKVVLSAASVAALVAAGATSAAAATSAAKHHAATNRPVIHETLVLLADSMAGKNGWPEFVGGSKIVWPKNSTIDLTIYAYDDMTTPLPKNLAFYDKVEGTVGGSEQIDGKTVTSLANKAISHTFTVNGMRLNLPIPEAPMAKPNTVRTPVVVTATFKTGKAGTFTWQCYAPCGSGHKGEGGAMAKNGYMTGTVEIS